MFKIFSFVFISRYYSTDGYPGIIVVLLEFSLNYPDINGERTKFISGSGEGCLG